MKSQNTYNQVLSGKADVGLGWGMQLTMPEVIGAAIGVYLFEVACAFLWLKCFAYGPLEWIWRMLTYGKRLPLKVRKL